MFKRLITIIALCLAFLSAWAKMKPLTFDNPGNRRLLKTETDSYYYFRAKPEKSMTLNVEGISSIELRSFAIAKLNKPKVISIIGKQSTTHDLVLQERLEGFYLYQPVTIRHSQGHQKHRDTLLRPQRLLPSVFHSARQASQTG